MEGGGGKTFSILQKNQEKFFFFHTWIKTGSKKLNIVQHPIPDTYNMQTPLNLFGVMWLPHVVCDVEQAPEGTWGLFQIDQGAYSNRKYNLYVLLNEKDVYLKPSQPYCSGKFEQLFGFGIGCRHYDSEKVVKVKDPLYYKQFVDYFDQEHINKLEQH